MSRVVEILTDYFKFAYQVNLTVKNIVFKNCVENITYSLKYEETM